MTQRIHSIDAVRALALLGILLAHAHGRFNYYTDFYPPFITDAVYDWAHEQVFLCKSFLVFAFLFGLSFFLQMDHAVAKGVDFRPRFCWRLVLLFGFGVFHSFFYQGDILTIFAVLGFIPVVLWKVPSRVLGVLCALCFLQPLALYHELSGTPDAMQDVAEQLRDYFGLCWLLPAKQESLWETGCWNLSNGIAHSWVYVLTSYRIWALVGMFLLGMLHDFGYEFTENGEKHAIIAGQILERSGYKYWQDVVNHSDKATDNMSDETFILNCADLSVSPDGKDITMAERVEDIGRRHGKDSTQYLIAFEKLQKLQADTRFSKIESYVLCFS